MKNRQYQGVQLSKKESELITWIQKGSNNYTQAFYEYPNRRKKGGIKTTSQKETSWFNKTLKGLKSKGFCLNVPFALPLLAWFNPGITNDTSQLKSETLQEDFQENRIERKKIF